MTPGPPLDPDAAVVRRQVEKGVWAGWACRSTTATRMFEQLSAKGVTFLQEPSDRPYGMETVKRDETGNWLVLVEPKEFTPEDFKYFLRDHRTGLTLMSSGYICRYDHVSYCRAPRRFSRCRSPRSTRRCPNREHRRSPRLNAGDDVGAAEIGHTR
jgi:hypothetical protein